MKYYVVSESELEALVTAVEHDSIYETVGTRQDLDSAEDACRARPVPKWATHFAGNIDGPYDYDLYEIGNYEEIKR